jgi:hypothetical protein
VLAAAAVLALDRDCENVKAQVSVADGQGLKEGKVDVVGMKEVGSMLTLEMGLLAGVEQCRLELEAISHVRCHQ